MFYLNKNPSGKRWNILMGLAELVDGFVRVFTLGYICTRYPLVVSRNQVRVAIENAKKARLNEKKA